MATAKNKNVVFSGLVKNVGRRLPAKTGCTRNYTRKVKVVMQGGPLHGYALYLADTSCTLPMTMRGHTGRYVGSQWVAA